MKKQNTNLKSHKAKIDQVDKEKLLNQKGCVIWFTGLSGSGKSTLAFKVESALYMRGHLTYVLDGDNIRCGLNKNLNFSPKDREENIRRIGEVARLFANAGVITIVAFISPYRTDRDNARNLIDDRRFIEVFVDCTLEVCEARDPKGLYKKARMGKIKDFTGISAPYEEPIHPELIVNTHNQAPKESVKCIIDFLERKKLISE